MSSALAEEFTVFEKDGFFGIRDEEGQVTVPAVYEKLGWSDGSTDVKNGVIGYRDGKLWGLITVKNRSLTEQEYYTITPLIDGLIKASIKGKFSNQLFHGVLNEQGKIVVSFHYFTISAIGNQLMVSEYENGIQKFGIISLENERLIPIRYQKISLLHDFYIAQSTAHTFDLFTQNGELLQSSLDSIYFLKGWKCFRNGYAGFVTLDGIESHAFESKNFELTDNILFPIPFPKWKVFKGQELLMEVNADSVVRNSRGFWITYLNGAHHINLTEDAKIEKDKNLIDVNDEYLILKDSKTNSWTLTNHTGELVATGYDSMIFLSTSVWAMDGLSWYLLDDAGVRINRFGYLKVLPGIGNQFVVKRNEHWGIIDEFGSEKTPFKYDSILPAVNGYKVGYLNKWGVINTAGDWLLRPEYAEVFTFNTVVVGRKGEGYTYQYDGAPTLKSESKPIQGNDFIIVQNPDGLLGLINKYGELQVYPNYEVITARGDYFELRQGEFIELVTLNGKRIIGLDDMVQEVGALEDSFFPVKKNDRWGFVDMMGRLRISNRYEKVKPFSDGLAAIALRNKWGFIDENERLVIQPYYRSVENFKDGLCIVQSDSGEGLINKEGREVVEMDWDMIQRVSTGNYLVRKNGKVGLIDSNGSFLLRPSFAELYDFAGKVVVSQNGKFGLLDYSGNQLLKLEHEEIKISDDYTLVKY